MKDKILRILGKKAPLIKWTVAPGTIEGSFYIIGRIISDSGIVINGNIVILASEIPDSNFLAVTQKGWVDECISMISKQIQVRKECFDYESKDM